MGIPRMFRWLSERYPLVSQLVEEYSIPEFDNLYLDMNGIIHNATHANKGSHLVLTDEKMFTSIFNYIEDLFDKIKPKKVFYMAIDGVAPRAKMNQQRARRFKTALEREKAKKVAINSGIEISDEAFDSNCITPGTLFMEKLTKQLKYFINKKITEDENWKNIEVIFSGHEVPGEGEHKIMEYIRTCKAQPDYNPNLRHCLYGLDADLIMLGLLSHDPHFSLLREEVTFGKKNKSSHGPPQFYLLHLSLVREYLNAEFSEFSSSMKFEYNLERVIDDFIMMVMFVGNDFLPHLPGFDIAEGVLTELFRGYGTWLKNGDGYINDSGTLNFKRLEQFLRLLHRFEYIQFLNLPDNANIQANEMMGYGNLQITENQLKWTKQVIEEVEKAQPFKITLEHIKSFKDIEFIKHLASDLDLKITHEYSTENPEDELPEFIYSISNDESESEIETETEDEGTVFIKKARGVIAIKKISAKYLNAPVVSNDEEKSSSEEAKRAFAKYKDNYYNIKLKFDKNDGESFDKLLNRYVEGLQWVMYYYYRGIPSWGWYYPYHYAPMLSDMIGLSKYKINFELGHPFKPFEQLMGVLPAQSRNLVPEGLRDLMTEQISPILDFYPIEFEQDANGKKQSWEAIALIPFIDEARLLKALSEREHKLTQDEKLRNRSGPAYLYRYDANIDEFFPSSLPGYLPSIRTSCKEEIYYLPKIEDGFQFKSFLCDGVQYGSDAPPGFPSLHTLKVIPKVKHAGLTIFDRATKHESVILDVVDLFKDKSIEEIATEHLGGRIYVGYPLSTLSKLVKMTTATHNYTLDKDHVVVTPLSDDQVKEFIKVSNQIESDFKVKKGVTIGKISVLLYYAPFVAMRYALDGSVEQHYAENLPPAPYPLQLTRFEVKRQDPRFIPKAPKPVEEVFPVGSKAFFLGDQYYGSPCKISGISKGGLSINLIHQGDHLKVGHAIIQQGKSGESWITARQLAKVTGYDALALSKLSSKFKISCKTKKSSEVLNIGLNLKFEGKGEMALGYCRRGPRGWEYSAKAVELITSFTKTFPELMVHIANYDGPSPIVPIEDIYKTETEKKFNEIKEWYQKNDIKSISLSPVGSETVDKHTITKLQTYWDNFYKSNAKLDIIEVQNVPRSALLPPSDEVMQLGRQKFHLGDRVIFTKESSKVPICLRGTIIGIEGTNLEVLFDRTFINGTNLDGRCAEHRGLWIQPNWLLNLSYPQLTPSKLEEFLKKDLIKPIYQSRSSSNNDQGKSSTPQSPRNGLKGNDNQQSFKNNNHNHNNPSSKSNNPWSQNRNNMNSANLHHNSNPGSNQGYRGGSRGRGGHSNGPRSSH